MQQKCCWCWKMYRKNPVIANKLHYLRRQRNIADYDTKLVMKADDADKAVKLAGEIMNERDRNGKGA